jgi:hypothetical protein
MFTKNRHKSVQSQGCTTNHQHDADKILAEAEDIIQTIAKALEDEKLRTTFLNAAFSS